MFRLPWKTFSSCDPYLKFRRKMIYFLHNPQTGRFQQSTDLQAFNSFDREAFNRILQKHWLNRDVQSGNGSTVYRVSRI